MTAPTMQQKSVISSTVVRAISFLSVFAKPLIRWLVKFDISRFISFAAAIPHRHIARKTGAAFAVLPLRLWIVMQQEDMRLSNG